ncbi:MAG: cbb3-type cytochrome oxidase subunit 3 [Bdellovibrionia bacterium]
MKQKGLLYFTDIDITVLGLVIFFTCFAGICLWAYRKNSKKIYNYVEQLPLQDGE